MGKRGGRKNVRAYAAAPTEERVYAENYQNVIGCNLHHLAVSSKYQISKDYSNEKDCKLRPRVHNGLPAKCDSFSVCEKDISRISVEAENQQKMELVESLCGLKNPTEIQKWSHLVATRLGSVDVIIWNRLLAYHRALIDCYEKVGRFLFDANSRSSRREAKKDRLVTVHVSRLAHRRVRSPKRLSPSEMLELSNQLLKNLKKNKRRVLFDKSLTMGTPFGGVRKLIMDEAQLLDIQYIRLSQMFKYLWRIEIEENLEIFEDLLRRKRDVKKLSRENPISQSSLELSARS
ncbi:hypothetical protein Tco_1236227 [Tanacetum coccineum]